MKVRELDANFPLIRKDIRRLEHAVTQARHLAAHHAERVLNAAIERDGDLRSDIDRAQVLDLTWAIRGLAISALGVFLGFFG